MGPPWVLECFLGKSFLKYLFIVTGRGREICSPGRTTIIKDKVLGAFCEPCEVPGVPWTISASLSAHFLRVCDPHPILPDLSHPVGQQPCLCTGYAIASTPD